MKTVQNKLFVFESKQKKCLEKKSETFPLAVTNDTRTPLYLPTTLETKIRYKGLHRMTSTKFPSKLQAIFSRPNTKQMALRHRSFRNFTIKLNLDRIISLTHDTTFLFLELNVPKCTGKESV